MAKIIPARGRGPSGEEGGGGRRSFGNIPGAPVETRRQLLVKLCWMTLWMVFLIYPVEDLVRGGHGAAAAVAGWTALVVFLLSYWSLVALRSTRPAGWWGKYVPPVLMFTLALVTSFTLGPAWLTLFTYTSVCVAVVLPAERGVYGVLALTAVTLAVAVAVHADADTMLAVVVPCLLSGLAMNGLQRLVATMRELREARATVAHLAASEERLRLARDLHDLLGHSLSLIAIKSELTGRLMDAGRQDAARAQVADIEKVARESLADVRSAVSGFRRPTLGVELAGARTALATAQIELEADPAVADGRPGLGEEEAGALAWALREGVTNVVRHGAGATVCSVTVDETWEGEGDRYAVLEVVDNGRGPGKAGPGNGLSGLAERLELVGGRLESGSGPRGRGFRLRALVPLAPVAAPGGTTAVDGS
ncbi:sensor histidine kinase [Kitasatospora camelliae]|uniref:Sensor histidine kinase n=1 Tax=Kitasatospora camelliae TaxID=3156397 RepID=A0AAU8K1R0_9ACTN